MGEAPTGGGQIDFLGIGSQKAATTWLYKHLKSHPAVRFPARKEVHYWDLEWPAGVPVAEYLARFPKPERGVRQGEITPRYSVIDPSAVAALAEALPKVRVFCTVRNPIARAWSHAQMVRRYAWLDPDEASPQFYLDVCLSADSCRRGDFTAWLATWRSVVPEKRLLVIDYEDIASDPRGVLARLASFLRVDADEFEQREDEGLRRKVPAGRVVKGERRRPPPPELLDALRRHYRPMMAAMGEVLGRDVSSWLEWDGTEGDAGGGA